MIDVQKLCSDASYRQRSIDKGADPGLIDKVCDLSSARSEHLQTTEATRAKANSMAKEIGAAAPDEREVKIAEASELKAELAVAEEKLETIQSEFDSLSLEIPNPAHESVPQGGEENFQVEEVFGSTPAAKISHGDIGEALGIVDTERAVRMSGSRFGYIMAEAARLQFGLIQWTLEKLDSYGFVPVVTPVLVREEMMELSGFFPTDKSTAYKIEGDDHYLIGTSEVALAGLHRQEQLDVDNLPLRYAGYSSCFRREAGTYGKDTSGLFRLHQFDKVEMFTYVHPDNSWDELERIRKIQTEIFSELELPFRVITTAAKDLGSAAAKKYDLEVWLPSEQRYREITSCSNYTDYSARRMNTTVKIDGKKQLVHTLNGTACAVGRTLLNIFENHQTDDGAVLIPKVLQPYCGGIEAIEPKN